MRVDISIHASGAVSWTQHGRLTARKILLLALQGRLPGIINIFIIADLYVLVCL